MASVAGIEDSVFENAIGGSGEMARGPDSGAFTSLARKLSSTFPINAQTIPD